MTCNLESVVRAEAIFTLPYSGLSGLRPSVTGGCLPASAELASVCSWGPCQRFLGETPWSLSGSFTADLFFFIIFASTMSMGELSRGACCGRAGSRRSRNAGQLRAWSTGTIQGRMSSSAGIVSSLVKVKAQADNREPCVAATGSLTLNFWTPYSMKLYIIPSLAPQGCL